MNYHHIMNPFGSAEDMTVRVTAAVQLGGSTPAECLTYAQRAYDDLTKFCESVHGWLKPSVLDYLNLSGQNPLWVSEDMTDRKVRSERARVIVHLNNLHLWLTTKHPTDGAIESFWGEQVYPKWYKQRQSVSLYTSEMNASLVLNPNTQDGKRYVELSMGDSTPESTRQQWYKLKL